jgi:hypothetical protein
VREDQACHAAERGVLIGAGRGEHGVEEPVQPLVVTLLADEHAPRAAQLVICLLGK